MGYFFSLSKAAASTGLDISELILLVFGAVLVLGIFGEYKKLPTRLLQWPTFVFQILVMIGVAGELLGDGGVFVFSSSLQAAEDRELSDIGANVGQLEGRLKTVGDKASQAESKAATASTKSIDAVIASGNAMTLARGARQEADSFGRDIALAKNQAADAEAHLAESMRRATNAENDLLRLRGQMADREITPAQRENMLRVLGTRPPGHIVIQSLLGAGREAQQYARKIFSLFHDDAHWDAVAPTGMGTTEFPVSGVFVVKGPNSEELSNFIVDVLIAGELATAPVITSPSKDTAAGTVEIWVASRTPIQKR